MHDSSKAVVSSASNLAGINIDVTEGASNLKSAIASDSKAFSAQLSIAKQALDDKGPTVQKTPTVGVGGEESSNAKKIKLGSVDDLNQATNRVEGLNDVDSNQIVALVSSEVSTVNKKVLSTSTEESFTTTAATTSTKTALGTTLGTTPGKTDATLAAASAVTNAAVVVNDGSELTKETVTASTSSPLNNTKLLNNSVSGQVGGSALGSSTGKQVLSALVTSVDTLKTPSEVRTTASLSANIPAAVGQDQLLNTNASNPVAPTRENTNVRAGNEPLDKSSLLANIKTDPKQNAVSRSLVVPGSEKVSSESVKSTLQSPMPAADNKASITAVVQSKEVLLAGDRKIVASKPTSTSPVLLQAGVGRASDLEKVSATATAVTDLNTSNGAKPAELSANLTVLPGVKANNLAGVQASMEDLIPVSGMNKEKLNQSTVATLDVAKQAHSNGTTRNDDAGRVGVQTTLGPAIAVPSAAEKSTSTPNEQTIVPSIVSSNTAEKSSTEIGSTPVSKTNTAETGLANNTDSSGSNNPSKHAPNQEIAAKINKEQMVEQVREMVVEQKQMKATEVTASIIQTASSKVALNTDLTAISATGNSVDTVSSNVYHATSNGIITANSSSLNTGMPGSLSSAPSTLFLGEPDADQSLLDNVRWVVNEKLSRATINVSPAHLGPITLSVDVESQNMNVSIIANNAIAKEALDSLMPRMREHFSNEGYQTISVDVSSQEQQNQRGSLQGQSGGAYESKSNAGADRFNSNDQESELSSTPNTHRSSSHSLISTYA